MTKPSLQAPGGNRAFRFEMYGRFVKKAVGSLGTATNPAASCDSLAAKAPESRSGAYIIGIGTHVQTVYCDFCDKDDCSKSNKREGWTLLLKAKAGTRFAYESRYWTRANTLNKHTVNNRLGDAKYPQYNEMEITHLRARWLDNDGLPNTVLNEWRLGPFHPTTALQLLQQPQVLRDTSGVLGPRFQLSRSDKKFFSSTNKGLYGINLDNDQGSVRWGYSWRSRSGRIVAMGGLGMSSNSFAMSAGDAYKCCGRGARLGNRAMAVQLFGRYDWQGGNIAHGHLGSRANPAMGCEELRSVYSTSNAFWVGLGKNVHHVWCDLSSWNGGWTLLLKTKSSGSTFEYGSKHWTEATTLNTDSVANAISEDKDAKFSAFNSRHITHVLAHWPAGNFVWRHGPVLPQTALELFSTTSVLSTTPSTDTGFNPQYFSSLPGSQLFGINLKHATGRVRWGYSFSAEKTWGTPSQKNWRLTVHSVQAKGGTSVQLSEAAFMTSSGEQLGKDTVVPKLSSKLPELNVDGDYLRSGVFTAKLGSFNGIAANTYEFKVARLPTSPGGRYTGKGAYSKLMIQICKGYNMKPICDHRVYCKTDPDSIYLGQIHHLSYPPHRNDKSKNVPGFSAIKNKWQGLCVYTGVHGAKVKGRPGALCNIPTNTHTWRHPSQANPGFVCGRVYEGTPASKRLAMLNNGDGSARDKVFCNSLPCSFSYSFDEAVVPDKIVLAHAGSARNFPLRVSVSYQDSQDISTKWNVLSTFNVNAPRPGKLQTWPTKAKVVMSTEGGIGLGGPAKLSAGDYSCSPACDNIKGFKPAAHSGSQQIRIYGQYAQPADGHLGSKARPSPSCEHIREAGFQHSGEYFIGVGNAVHKVYCELNIAGGGWSLLMKGAANRRTFSYNSQYWTTTRLLNAHDVSLRDDDAKYSAFNSFEIKELLVHWPSQNQLSSGHRTFWKVSLEQATTALDLFRSSQNANLVLSEHSYSGRQQQKEDPNFDPEYFSALGDARNAVRRMAVNWNTRDGGYATRLGFSWSDSQDRSNTIVRCTSVAI